MEIVIPYEPRELQLSLHNNLARWNVVVCHRRFGKTVFAINELIKQNMTCNKLNPRFAYLAPTYKQAKTIAWDYLQYYSRPIPKIQINQTELRIDYPNGGRIQLFGCDNPDSLRGIYLDGAVLDEYAQMPDGLFGEVIRPALSDRKGGAIFIGTPKGKNAFYDMYTHAVADDKWNAVVYKASETGIVDDEELNDAKRIMSDGEFEQEYECSWDAATQGSIYSSYDRELNNCDTIEDGFEPLFIGMDFNVNNMSAIVHVKRNGEPHAVDELCGIFDTPAMIQAINDRYCRVGRSINIYPDASGNSRKSVNAGITDIMLLQQNGFNVYNDNVNPRVRDRINSMQAAFCNALGERIYRVNYNRCPGYSNDLLQQTYAKNGDPDKSKGNDHRNDAGGYFINYDYSIIKPLTRLDVRMPT